MTELTTLVRYVEDYLDMTTEARALAERDRDYYDNKQLTDAELSVLRQRKQPPVVFNRIKPKIDSLLGFERSQRTDPRAYPRTPKHEQDAESVTDALRFVCDDQRFQNKRSSVAENVFIEGVGGMMVGVKPSKSGFDVVLNEISWDRIFYDPYSTRRDFSDAKYRGFMLWLDEDEALQTFQGKDDVIKGALADTSKSDTFDDKPRFAWGDSERRRIRIAHIYFRSAGKEYTAIFTKSGFLHDVKLSPFLDADGEPTCPIVLASAYIDRENNRYGVVRQHIHPQDEINKRRSKALHLLNINRVIAEQGAVNDLNQLREEVAKPDGVIVRNPGFELEILSGAELAQGQLQLLQEAKAEIDNVGISPQLGGKEGDNKSGRAIQALQQAGLNEMAVVFDSVRDWSLRVYSQIWLRVRQFWTEERWIRVTDDERNLKWVGINAPITLAQHLEEQGQRPGIDFDPNDPRTQMVVGKKNSVADLDVDIIVEDAPDSVNIQSEQFEMLVQMYQSSPDKIPLDMVIEASTLRNKRRLLEKLAGDPAQAEMAKDAAMLNREKAVADIEETKSKAAKNIADAESAAMLHQREAIQNQMAAEFGTRMPVISVN